MAFVEAAITYNPGSNNSRIMIFRKLEKDLLMRNLALKTLTDEYEIAKAKVRRYRAERSNLSMDNKENVNTTKSSAFVDQVTIFQVMSENDALKKAKSNLEKDLNEINRLNEVLSKKVSHLKVVTDVQMIDKETCRLGNETANAGRSKKDSLTNSAKQESMIAAVRLEMLRFKNACVRAGSEKAIAKASTIFASELRRLESSHNAVIDLLRKQLEHLAGEYIKLNFS